MSGDSKIGLQIGGVGRVTPVRRAADSAVAGTATQRPAIADPLPAAGLIRMASDLAAEPVPVDSGRVAALRSAIAEGRYTVDAGAIAGAMIDHYRGAAGR